MLEQKDMTRGGKRKGSGRSLKYGEPTVVVQTRVPESKAKLFKKKVQVILKVWEKKKP